MRPMVWVAFRCYRSISFFICPNLNRISACSAFKSHSAHTISLQSCTFPTPCTWKMCWPVDVELMAYKLCLLKLCINLHVLHASQWKVPVSVRRLSYFSSHRYIMICPYRAAQRRQMGKEWLMQQRERSSVEQYGLQARWGLAMEIFTVWIVFGPNSSIWNKT